MKVVRYGEDTDKIRFYCITLGEVILPGHSDNFRRALQAPNLPAVERHCVEHGTIRLISCFGITF